VSEADGSRSELLQYFVTVLHPFDRGPVQIRISVAASDSGGIPDEVFMLERASGDEDAQAIERLITNELKGIVSDSAEDDWPPEPHSLKVERSSTSRGGEFSSLLIEHRCRRGGLNCGQPDRTGVPPHSFKGPARRCTTN
jgi:hypothetical protein